MSKGDVTLKFDANTGAFVQKMLAAQNAMKATADSSRSLGESTSKSGGLLADLGSVGSKNMASLQSSLMGAVGGFNLMSMAISSITARPTQTGKIKRSSSTKPT